MNVVQRKILMNARQVHPHHRAAVQVAHHRRVHHRHQVAVRVVPVAVCALVRAPVIRKFLVKKGESRYNIPCYLTEFENRVILYSVSDEF